MRYDWSRICRPYVIPRLRVIFVVDLMASKMAEIVMLPHLKMNVLSYISCSLHYLSGGFSWREVLVLQTNYASPVQFCEQ